MSSEPVAALAEWSAEWLDRSGLNYSGDERESFWRTRCASSAP